MNLSLLKPLQKLVLAVLYFLISSCLKKTFWNSAEQLILNHQIRYLTQKLRTCKLIQIHLLRASQGMELRTRRSDIELSSGR